MSPWLYYPVAVLLVLANGVAWLSTLLTLPGNWLMLGFAALFAWWTADDPEHGIRWATVGIAAVLAVIGELIEFGAGAAGAASKGASKRAIGLSLVGALVGSLAGFVVGTPVPVIGSLVVGVLGGAVGAFAGAYLGETWKGRTDADRMAAGQGAFTGKLWGTLGKLIVGAVMFAVIAVDAFW
jgi:uncharacterized protein YqgC (DUF456 family)